MKGNRWNLIFRSWPVTCERFADQKSIISTSMTKFKDYQLTLFATINLLIILSISFSQRSLDSFLTTAGVTKWQLYVRTGVRFHRHSFKEIILREYCLQCRSALQTYKGIKKSQFTYTSIIFLELQKTAKIPMKIYL